MRLTITNQKIRFRVSADELAALSAGDNVEARIDIGGTGFFGRILPGDEAGEMRVALGEGGITLNVSQTVLQDLHALGRSKDGLSVTQGDVVVALQLDLKTAARVAG